MTQIAKDELGQRFAAVPIDQLDVDPDVQVRSGINSKTVAAFVAAMEAGDRFPPVRVFELDDGAWLLVDGHHRVEAMRMLGKTHIEAQLEPGDREEAWVLALKLNGRAPAKLTNEEKRTNLRRFLSDRRWSNCTTKWIAEEFGFSRPFVDKIRRELGADTDQRAGRDGRMYSSAAQSEDGQESGDAEDIDAAQEAEGGDQDVPRDYPPAGLGASVASAVIQQGFSAWSISKEAWQQGLSVMDDVPVYLAVLDALKRSTKLIRYLGQTATNSNERATAGMLDLFREAVDQLEEVTSAVESNLLPVRLCDSCGGDGCDDCYGYGALTQADLDAPE